MGFLCMRAQTCRYAGNRIHIPADGVTLFHWFAVGSDEPEYAQMSNKGTVETDCLLACLCANNIGSVLTGAICRLCIHIFRKIYYCRCGSACGCSFSGTHDTGWSQKYYPEIIGILQTAVCLYDPLALPWPLLVLTMFIKVTLLYTMYRLQDSIELS